MSDDVKSTSGAIPLRRMVPCPECGTQSSREDYPFCSDRCRNLDLSRWLKGSYAIPASDDESNPDGDHH
jgi:endogenous inhibitor of DNA gyrase (YacG/DUF329 family)